MLVLVAEVQFVQILFGRNAAHSWMILARPLCSYVTDASRQVEWEILERFRYCGYSDWLLSTHDGNAASCETKPSLPAREAAYARKCAGCRLRSLCLRRRDNSTRRTSRSTDRHSHRVARRPLWASGSAQRPRCETWDRRWGRCCRLRLPRIVGHRLV